MFGEDLAKLVDLAKAYALATAGNVDGLRALIEETDVSYATLLGGIQSLGIFTSYWQTPMGRFHLRLLALKGISCDKLSIVQYLCGEQGVHPLAEARPDEFGKNLQILYRFHSNTFLISWVSFQFKSFKPDSLNAYTKGNAFPP